MKAMSGEIASIAIKSGASGPFAEVALWENGKRDRKYPTKYRAFDSVLVARLQQRHKGERIGLEIEEVPGLYQGKAVTHQNIVGIGESEPMSPVPLGETDAGGRWTQDARLLITWGQSINCAVARMGVGQLDDAYFHVMAEAANRFYLIILGGPELTPDIITEPAPLTRASIIKWAVEEGGYADIKAMAVVPGVTTAMHEGRFGDALNLLKQAKGSEK